MSTVFRPRIAGVLSIVMANRKRLCLLMDGSIWPVEQGARSGSLPLLTNLTVSEVSSITKQAKPAASAL